MLLDVALLRLRRPIHNNPSGYLRFAALATKPGEKSGLELKSGRMSAMHEDSGRETSVADDASSWILAIGAVHRFVLGRARKTATLEGFLLLRGKGTR